MYKNILIATGIYPPDIGGPATYVKILEEEFSRRGFEVRIITYGDSKGVKDNNGARVIKVDRNQNVVFRYIDYFLEVLRNLSWAEAVYVQGPVSEGFPTFLACKVRRKGYILKVVGDYAWEQFRQVSESSVNVENFQKGKYNVKTELHRKVQKLVAKGAKKVITPSNYLKGVIKQWGIHDEKINVIYNAVSVPEIKKGKSTLKSELGLKGDIILSAGRLVPWKGFNTLIGLMPELLKGNVNFKLVIAGDGPEKNSLKRQIKKLNLEKSVFLAGQLEKNELWRLMKASDMFVLNSEYEGLSHIVIEAMVVGVPVIASSCGGNFELIKHNFTGLLIEYNNREQLQLNIIKLWHNRVVANEIVRNAQNLSCEKFSNNNMVISLIGELNK